MSPDSRTPNDNPAMFSPQKAAEQLRHTGVPDDAWSHIAESGLSSHWNRTLIDIALGTETVDVLEHLDKLFGDEPHGQQRAGNLRGVLGIINKIDH